MKSSYAIAASILNRVLSINGTVPVTTFDTVFGDTPARTATSFIVARGTVATLSSGQPG